MFSDYVVKPELEHSNQQLILSNDCDEIYCTEHISCYFEERDNEITYLIEEHLKRKNDGNTLKMGNYLNKCALVILAKEWNKSVAIISSKITLIISDKLSYSSWWLTSIERLFEIKHKFENGQRLMKYKIKDFSKILVCELCNEIIEKYEHICDCSVTLEVSLDWFGSQSGWEKTRHDVS